MKSARSLTEPADRHTGRVFPLIFFVLAMGIIAAGYFYYRNQERQFRTEAEHQLSAIADLKVGELTQWRKERLGDGGILFRNATISDLVRSVLEKPEDADAQRQLQMWFGQFGKHIRYEHIRLLDTQGVTRLSWPAGLPPAAPIVLEHASEAYRSGQVTLQDFYHSAEDQKVSMALLIPIFDGSDANRPLGMLVLRIDPATYLYPLISRWPVPSAMAETLLVRREGNEAVFLNELRFQTNSALNLRSSLTNTSMPAVKAVLGQEGVVEGRDYRGVPVLAALRAIPDSPWFMVARRDITEVYAPLRAQLWQVIVMIGILLFGAGTCVDLVWRQQRVRFYRERAEMATALQESEALLNETGRLGKIGGWSIDLATGKLRWTREVYAIHEVEEDFQPTVEAAINFYAPESGPVIQQAVDRAITAGETFDVELALITARKRHIWVRAVGHAVLENGKAVTVSGTFQDITERKQAEQALLQSRKAALNMMTDAVKARDRAEQMSVELSKHRDHLEQLVAERTADLTRRTVELDVANKELEAFSYSVSHDLRAPLRGIDGWSLALLEDYGGQLDERGRTFLGRVRAETQRMGALVDDLLQLSRLSRAEMCRQPVDLSGIARTLAARLHETAPDRTVEFIIQPDLIAQGDAPLLEVALSNLLGNAFKFTGKRTQARIEFGRTDGAGGNAFFVRDNGAGFDMAYAKKLFGAFQRMHKTSDFPGTGIGLATVQRIVHRHGGRVWAEAAVDRGATFYFTLGEV